MRLARSRHRIRNGAGAGRVALVCIAPGVHQHLRRVGVRARRVLLVAAAALAAAYFPSRRAARIDPVTTLRYD